MTKRTVLGFIMIMLVLTMSAMAGGKDELQKYFNNTSTKVKAAENPIEKRAILQHSFQTMSQAVNVIHNSPLVSQKDAAGLDRFQASLQEKQDELVGENGFVRVSDDQLDSFADYALQDMEQAEVVTISLVTLLLVILIVAIIAR